MYTYFRKIGNTELISAWESKRLCHKSVKSSAIPNNSLTPALNYIDVKTRVKFDGSCFKQDKIIFTYGNIVNIYIVYEINLFHFEYDDHHVLKKSLIGPVKLTKNAK